MPNKRDTIETILIAAGFYVVFLILAAWYLVHWANETRKPLVEIYTSQGFRTHAVSGKIYCVKPDGTLMLPTRRY